jgi:hypothetical protein
LYSIERQNPKATADVYFSMLDSGLKFHKELKGGRRGNFRDPTSLASNSQARCDSLSGSVTIAIVFVEKSGGLWGIKILRVRSLTLLFLSVVEER